MKPEQNDAAYAILNNYHGPCVDEIKKVIETAKDADELKIVADLLRGSVEHLLTKHASECLSISGANSPRAGV